MRFNSLFVLAVLGTFGIHGPVQSADADYTFNGGFPTPETVQRAYDNVDLNRAVQSYRIFYPTVSGAAIVKGNAKIGVIPNVESFADRRRPGDFEEVQ